VARAAHHPREDTLKHAGSIAYWLLIGVLLAVLVATVAVTR
jgi:hypothetical protein